MLTYELDMLGVLSEHVLPQSAANAAIGLASIIF